MPDGSPVPRGSAPAPCSSCPKVPTWAKRDGARTWQQLQALAEDMSAENRSALERYREFRAVSRFPDDEIVTWYSGLLGAVFEEWERVPLVESTNATRQLIQLLVKGKK